MNNTRDDWIVQSEKVMYMLAESLTAMMPTAAAIAMAIINTMRGFTDQLYRFQFSLNFVHA